MGFLFETVIVAKDVWLWLSGSSIRDQIILICALPSLCILVSIFRSLSSLEHQHFPMVGKGKSILLPTWRARLRYITQGVELIKNGYLKASLHTHYLQD